jgi:hypothetical protein
VRDPLSGGVTDRGACQGADRAEDNCSCNRPDRGIAGPFLRSRAHRNDGDRRNKHHFGKFHESPSAPCPLRINAAI